MKIDDLRKRYNAIMADPEKGIADAPQLLADIETDYTTAESVSARVAELENKVKELQDANVKLYLATTETVTDEESEELDGEELIDSIFEKLESED